LNEVTVRTISIVTGLIIGIINYFYFVRSGRYLRLIEASKNCSPQCLQNKSRLAILFCILSFGSPFILGFVKSYLL
jgi:hypothetical protein